MELGSICYPMANHASEEARERFSKKSHDEDERGEHNLGNKAARMEALRKARKAKQMRKKD